MRLALILLSMLAAGCASEPLAVVPPPGVDLSGHWRLDAADSDDPQRLLQATNAAEGTAAAGGDGGGERSGGSRGMQAGPAGAGIPLAAVGEVMQWPGQDLVIKQVGGTAAFSSDGESHVYQPADPSTAKVRRDHRRRSQLRCGWLGSSLMVQVRPDDDGPVIEARYQVSTDGTRLIQRLTPAGGPGEGAAISRVWTRVP